MGHPSAALPWRLRQAGWSVGHLRQPRPHRPGAGAPCPRLRTQLTPEPPTRTLQPMPSRAGVTACARRVMCETSLFGVANADTAATAKWMAATRGTWEEQGQPLSVLLAAGCA